MPPTRHAPKTPLALLTPLTLGFLALAFLAAPAHAQNTGKITGTVRDSSSRPIPFANVILKEIGLGVIAGEDGKYVFEGVTPGTYSVIFRHISVETREVSGVAVRAGVTTNMGDITLKEAIAAEIDVTRVEANKIEKLQKDDSGTLRVIDTKEQGKIRAINTTEEAIATQAGVVQLGDQFFVRGGRSSAR